MEKLAKSLGNLTTASNSPGRRELFAVIAFCLVIFFSSVFLYSRNNNFSSFYHPDEALKERQIAEKQRWYGHPQLLLEGTELALKFWRNRPTSKLEWGHEIILAGRWTSACFAALTVVTLSLVGYHYARFVGLVVAAVSVGLCPSLLLHAHYMKEDTALVLGIAVTLLAALIYDAPNSGRGSLIKLLSLGVAAGIAASGKYLGIVALIATLVFVIPKGPGQLWWRWATIILAFAMTAALINYRIFLDWHGFETGLKGQTTHVLTQHFGGTVMDWPNSFFARGVIRETMPQILIGAGLFLISLPLFWERTSRWDLFLTLFSAGFAIILAFCIIPEYRYNLPIIVMLHLMAALAVVRLAATIRAPFNWIVVVVSLSIMTPLQLQRCLNYLHQFADDSRVRLRTFVLHNLPPQSVVWADAYAIQLYDDDPRLANDERKMPSTFRMSFWVADFGDFDSLSSLGVNYIAVSEKAYARFFDPYIHAAPDDWRYTARKRFYEKLFSQGELVWSSNPDPPTYSFVNPALRLYRISESH